MLTRKIQFRTVITASIVLTVVCTIPWIDVAVAQDTTAQDNDAVIRVYMLKHSRAENLSSTIIKFLDKGDRSRSRMKIASDFRTNALLVYATPETLAEIEAIVNQLDVPATAATARQITRGGAPPAIPVELRIFWLATGPPTGKSTDRPAELKQVADALEKKDIKNLRLVGQIMINMRTENTFEALSTPIFHGHFANLNVFGQASRRMDELAINISLFVTRGVATPTGKTVPEKGSDAVDNKTRLASLKTTILVKPGEYMVLWLAPVQGITSVFVIQANIIE